MSGGADIETEYRASLKRERDRDRSHRQTKQGEFEAAFVSLDQFPADAEKFESWYSDGGGGVDAIIDHCDGTTPETLYARRLKNARQRLRRNAPELLEVFNLVVKNGKNKEESIWEMVVNKRTNGRPPETDIGFT